MLLFTFVAAALLGSAEATCSWDNCAAYTSDGINVHLVAHSHDDVGWLKTADEYYYGLNRSIAPGAVKLTISTVMSELAKDPGRKFAQCETAFFWRWWREQDDFTRHRVIRFVNDGQLEFINGGWVMNDEAAAHYTAIVDQMTFGLRFLNHTFGECGRPKVGWQIDPFGHSKEMANIFAQIGMEAFFFSRLHYNDHDLRAKTKALNLNWRASQDLGDESDIFTQVMFDGYGPPPGFCWDAYCDDDLLATDDRLENYNLDSKLAALTKWAQKQAASFKTNHIMLPMGSDFQYTNAQMWYDNLDALINYAKEQKEAGKSKLNLFYSTPTCYERAARAAGPKAWPPKTDDFFPYASDSQSYWAGYFTSRPGLKGYVRYANNYLQMCKQLDANAQLDDSREAELHVLSRAMGVAQHHDAVSGTAKQHVTDDYAKALAAGIAECQTLTNEAMAKLLGPAFGGQAFCLHLNESVCHVSQHNDKFTVTLFNTLGQNSTSVVRIPISRPYATVRDARGRRLNSQVISSYVPASQLGYVRSPAPYTLVFAPSLPPVGFASFAVSATSTAPPFRRRALRRRAKKWRELREERLGRRAGATSLSISNDAITVHFDPASGLMKSIEAMGLDVPVEQDLIYYIGANSTKQRASGAYIFRPNTTQTYRLAGKLVRTQRLTGPLTEEVRQVFGDWGSQVIRLTKGQPYVEVEWTVGPLPNDTVGREVVARYTTTIASRGQFTTDASGRQLLLRKRNFAPTYKYNNSQPAAGNYYPVDSMIAINDSKAQLTVLVDRAEGGSSLKDGQVELMLHRRLFVDDGFGVAEPLDEPGVDGRGLVVRGRHWLLLAKPEEAARGYRSLQKRLFAQPIAAFRAGIGKGVSFSGLRRPLPPNVHLMTEEQWQGSMVGVKTMLLRFEHIYQRGEDARMSRDASFSLQSLFTRFDVASCTELMLGANERKTAHGALRGLALTLRPMQYATLECVIRPR